MPESIKTIGEQSFYGCTTLKTINLEYVTSISACSFQHCSALKYIDMPLIEEIPTYAFYGCSALIKANIPKTKSIGDGAFSYCCALKQMISPSLESVNSLAFASDYSLEKIDTSNVKILGTQQTEDEITGGVFEYCNLISVYLPKIEKMGDGIFYESSVTKVVIGKNFSTYYNIPISSSITVYGYSGSLAQTYANANGNPFVAIDELGITTDLPTEKEVGQYDEATLSIVATGFEQAYQWYVTDSDVTAGTIIESATSSTLNLDTTTIGTKKYYVIITDWNGTTVTSNLCEISVVEKYRITATVIGDGIMSDSGDIYMLENSDKTFTFSANTGYHIESVVIDSVALVGDDLTNAITNGYTFTNITRNHTIAVTFVINTYTITVIQAKNGTISEAQESYNYGTSAYFTITANEGYYIEYLLIDGEKYTSTLTEYTFTNISDNHTISALFDLTSFSITANPTTNGTISPSGISNVLYGEDLNYTFTPDTGYKIKDVKIDNVSIGAVDYYTFVDVDCAHTISVEYEIQTFNISISFNGQGKINIDKTLENITYGETRTFTVSVEDGWELFKVYVNGDSVDISNNTFTVTNIKEDLKIQAIFKEKDKAAIFNLDTTTIAIIIGTAIISVLIIVLLIKSHRNSKRKKLKNTMQKTLALGNEQNNYQAKNGYKEYEKPYQMNTQTPLARPIPPNPMLQKALIFAQNNKDNFIGFCNKYNIDYRNNYNNAVLRYYQNYLRSNNLSPPPKNDNN